MLVGYYLEDWRAAGVKLPLRIFLEITPSILLVGKSGSGKSLSTLWYIHNALSKCESSIYIADFKGGKEYVAFRDTDIYANGDKAIEMIRKFYEYYLLIRSGEKKLEQHMTIVVEEWFGLLAYLDLKDKAVKKELMLKIGEILALGRGLGIGCWLCVQRASAELFPQGSREQFQIILSYGRISKEQRTMLFAGEDIDVSRNYSAGQGLVLIDGQQSGVQEIIVPYIRNQEVLCQRIREYLLTQKSLDVLCHDAAAGSG